MKILKTTFNKETFSIYFIDKKEEAVKKVKDLLIYENFGLDIETYKLPAFKENKKAGLDPHLSGISTIQLYPGKNDIFVFDCINCGLDWFHLIKHKNFVAHYGIFEIKHFTHNLFTNLNIGCSMLLSILVDRAEKSPFEAEIDEDEDEPSTWRGYGLDAIVGRLFDIRLAKHYQTHDWGLRPLNTEAIVYAGLDAVFTYRIQEKLIPQINLYKMGKHYRLLKQMQHVIAEMELAGVLIDEKRHQKLIDEWEIEQNKAGLDCKKHFGAINYNSTKQLAEWAVKKYPPDVINSWNRTPKGALGFGKSALAAMRHLPEMDALFKYKKLSKLISTYGTTLQAQKNPVTKRIHCSFSLGETRTGRLSSRDPNLQNIPRDSSMRDVFVCERGKKLIVADFNQIELRVAGEVSGDVVIRSAYKEGKDLHKIFASRMYKVPFEKVTKEQRQIAKSANFGAIYGMGAIKFKLYCLMNGVDIGLEEAEKTIDTLWNLYKGYAKWCFEIREKANSLGFVRTPLGKVRRLLPEEVYTKAPNTVVQGGAFEVMGLAMCELKERLKAHKNTSIINSVHDEIIIEAPADEAEAVSVNVRLAMNYGMLRIFPGATTNNLAAPVICNSWGEGK